jgi:hypothetical protein
LKDKDKDVLGKKDKICFKMKKILFERIRMVGICVEKVEQILDKGKLLFFIHFLLISLLFNFEAQIGFD